MSKQHFVDHASEQSHFKLISDGMAFLDSLPAARTMVYSDRIEAAKACAMLAEACKTNVNGS